MNSTYLNYLVFVFDMMFFLISAIALFKIKTLKENIHDRKQRYIIRIYCMRFYAYLGYGLIILSYLLCLYSYWFIFITIIAIYCFKEESNHRSKLYKY